MNHILYKFIHSLILVTLYAVPSHAQAINASVYNLEWIKGIENLMPSGTLEMSQHLPNVSTKLYADAMHELLMEVPAIRDVFLADVEAHYKAVLVSF